MRKFVLLSALFIGIYPASSLHSQEAAGKKILLNTCYAGNKVKRIYIPPPKEYFLRSARKGAATVTIKYTGFPDAVKPAMEKAASILASVLPDGINIVVLATWEKISTSGVLAQSSTTEMIPGWSIDAQVPFALYPVALAEKISGKAINKSSDGDIVLYVNNAVNWYLGTDGKTLSLKYDLVTVVLHELIHGLGFIDSMSASSTAGSYGVSGVPMVYDNFVENLAGNRLTDTTLFKNPSAELRTALTSGQLYFNGPLIKNYSGTRARLYAPATFDEGSSVSHLDENSTLEANALMTPIIDMGEAIHDPGKFTMSILGDLGWINTRISHTKPDDSEEHLISITLSASVKSDTLYNHNKVRLFWSFNGFSTSNSTIMSSVSTDNYSAVISIPSYNVRLDYYFSAEDCFGRVYKMPSWTDLKHYSVFIGIDTVKPVISNSTLSSFFEKVRAIPFTASVTDNLGVDTVILEYAVNDQTPVYRGFLHDAAVNYTCSLSPQALGISGGDSIRYRIVAKDKAATANLRTMPSSGWNTIRIETLKPVARYYSTIFAASASDFYNDGFTISKPSGFSGNGLNTPHPYVSPEESGDSLGYSATLRVPIKNDAGGMMLNFREVVLVEPGESGSVYGSPDFYDYVIVEGSKDFGLSWFALCNGYDSRYYDAWLDAYNSSNDGTNSTFVPDESLMIKHYIFVSPSSNLATGDTLMLRFRLFSDPYANGWGWIIRDLNIEPLTDNINDAGTSGIKLFPNPGNGIFTVRSAAGDLGGRVSYRIFNSTGICIFNGIGTAGDDISINISGHPPDLYLIVISSANGTRTLRYNLLK
jgi:hypothetical protein